MGKGFIIVNDYLQLPGHEKIFAVGDCSSVAEEKMAWNSYLHGKLIVNHVKRILKRKPLKEKYKPRNRPLAQMVALGSKYAVGVINNNIVLEGRNAARLKNLSFDKVPNLVLGLGAINRAREYNKMKKVVDYNDDDDDNDDDNYDEDDVDESGDSSLTTSSDTTTSSNL